MATKAKLEPLESEVPSLQDFAAFAREVGCDLPQGRELLLAVDRHLEDADWVTRLLTKSRRARLETRFY